MTGKGIWWSLQPFIADADANAFPDADRQDKLPIIMKDGRIHKNTAL